MYKVPTDLSSLTKGLPSLIMVSPEQFIKARANVRNIVGPNMLRAFAHHVVCCCLLLRLLGSCWMKFETGQTSSNNFQQVATTYNMVCKRFQHVGPNNVASCWPTMLRAFARALKANHFEPALRPNHQRSVADPAVILCLNKVSFICLYLFMSHEVSHHILEYPFKQ